MSLSRRKFLKGAMLLPSLATGSSLLLASPKNIFEQSKKIKRVRPTDLRWPSLEKWNQLKVAVNGNLIKIESPVNICKTNADKETCTDFFKSLKNPYFIGDSPALTQTSGYEGAWQSEPSVYAVAATCTADVVAAVNFARDHNLRLVVKGGGHSYQGTSNAPDSLLIWTRKMKKIELHDKFVPLDCEGKQEPQPAVSIEAGAMWMQAYDAVTTKGGRYVQGGGCATVGVAGLIQSGGFGSFSKTYGLASAALLEAEIVTSDGVAKIVNAAKYPDLFWALKGGGGGSFGVVTKVVLRTRELPKSFGAAFGSIKATDDKAFKSLIHQILSHYKKNLFNPNWGESISFHSDNSININMVFSGLTQKQAKEAWQELEQWITESPQSYSFEKPLTIIEIPAKYLWNNSFLRKYAATSIGVDERPQAPAENIYWAADKQQSGQFLYGYHSTWLPASLLQESKQADLANAIFLASRKWSLALHFNKGLAGANPEEIAAAEDTAINPAVLTAFALLIIGGESEPAFKGIAGYEPDKNGHEKAEQINKAMNEINKVVPNTGSYVAESNFFQKNWQVSFWGTNYKKLVAVKTKYDAEGLFFVHHGVGTENWSADGFTQLY
ncbi:MAG: FAD-binding protein [Ferruginibacter sp.]